MITAYKNIFDNVPFHLTIESALNRIKSGKSVALVEKVRAEIDKERANKLKSNLPSVCFSGKFTERKDECLIEHSGFICLDFDNVDAENKKNELSKLAFIHSCWVSPSGNGVKALVKIADGSKHREHFDSLKEILPDIDKSGVNVSRVCYESYDPNIYINENAIIYTKTKKTERVKVSQTITDNTEVFKNILKWLANKGDAFVTGERNIFMYKLASACCRFGISESEFLQLSTYEFPVGEDSFPMREMEAAAKSAYKSNAQHYGSAKFENEKLISKSEQKEIIINADYYDVSKKVNDVIYGEDVKKLALNIYDAGLPTIKGVGVAEVDDLYRPMKGEITLVSGYGNYGKSTFTKWYFVMRALLYGDKIGIFTPEENPSEMFYHSLCEILAGMNLKPTNSLRISRDAYMDTYDWVSEHFYYVYPKTMTPTPDYVKSVFLELIIKSKITTCVIDPFNQMANDYGSSGRDDKYLETFLRDCSRFAIDNGVYFYVVAHPTRTRKDDTGNYPCPDVFDIANGAMWNNKMDNILIYHRPYAQTEPQNPLCELHSKKIRRIGLTGQKGFSTFMLDFNRKRYLFDGVDPLATILNQ
jgi:hypothetical protein